MSMLSRDKILWSGLLIVGTYGSYALGANNVTNSTGIFSGLIPGLSDRALAIIGGIAIAAARDVSDPTTWGGSGIIAPPGVSLAAATTGGTVRAERPDGDVPSEFFLDRDADPDRDRS